MKPKIFYEKEAEKVPFYMSLYQVKEYNYKITPKVVFPYYESEESVVIKPKKPISKLFDYNDQLKIF